MKSKPSQLRQDCLIVPLWNIIEHGLSMKVIYTTDKKPFSLIQHTYKKGKK